MQIQPYLFFEGRAEEAIKFYQRAAGAQVLMMMRYKDSPVPPDPEKCPGMEGGGPPPDKVMHATLMIGGAALHLSDGRCSGRATFDGFSLSLNVPTTDDADRLYATLGEGGEVIMPLGPTFWSPKFGMFRDKFGLGWMVQVQAGVPGNEAGALAGRS